MQPARLGQNVSPWQPSAALLLPELERASPDDEAPVARLAAERAQRDVHCACQLVSLLLDRRAVQPGSGGVPCVRAFQRGSRALQLATPRGYGV